MTRKVPQRLAIYGGAFDPPHLGHDACLRALLEHWADRVLLVPSGTPPHKTASATPIGTRLAWCDAWAARYGDRVTLIDWEISGQLSGLTADLAERAAGTWRDTRLAVAIGADQFREFNTWHRGMDILKFAELIVIPRGGVPADPNYLHHLRREGHTVTVLDTDPIVASSTAIRDLQVAGDPTWRTMMLPEVARIGPAVPAGASA